MKIEEIKMLTRRDLEKRLDLSDEQVSFMYAKRILPEGVKVGGIIRFRENDIAKFEAYLRKRNKCRERGIDPDSAQGPAPPVYSTAGPPRFDPRLVVANEIEAERQKRSRTLAKGTTPIGPQQHVELPEVKTNKSKAK